LNKNGFYKYCQLREVTSRNDCEIGQLKYQLTEYYYNINQLKDVIARLDNKTFSITNSIYKQDIGEEDTGFRIIGNARERGISGSDNISDNDSSDCKV
ncbi:1238_t:CDS:2, partial [Funneliformis caledonium]